jgi:hypothetical protein
MTESPERTDDGRYIVVEGRRWRASDPGIPDLLRAQLVAELMAARRAVRDDPTHARPRVQDAKVALGERGEPWWESASAEGLRSRLAATMRTLLRHRDTDSTICPSDAARVVGGGQWRDLMDDARLVAGELCRDGVLVVRQGGRDVDLATSTGPISLLLAPLGVVALRGCPTCWLVGLTQTISRGRLERSCVEDQGCRLSYPPAMIAAAASVPERQALSTRGEPSGHH